MLVQLSGGIHKFPVQMRYEQKNKIEAEESKAARSAA